MAGTVVDVDTDDFVTASNAASTAAASVRRARDTARSAMSGLAQMGGSDPSGVKWSTSYDQAAVQAFTGLDGLVGGLGMVAAGLMITGNNYATADWHSAGHAGTPPGCVTPTLPVGECTAPPPSASGGSRTSPIPGFHYIADFIGDLWPDGDTGKLRQASSAWSSLASSLDSVGGSGMARVTGALAGSSTPEMPAITDTVGRVRSNVSEVARECRAFASACAKFADQIDDVHKQTERELQNLLLQIEATAAVSIGLTIFTAGISDAVGAGAVAAEVGFSVTRILAFIAQLARDVVAVVDDIGVAAGTFTKAIGLSEKVGVRLVAVTSKSVAYGVEGAGVNVTVQAVVNPGSDLSDAATQGFVGGAAFGVLGETAGAVGRAAGIRAANKAARLGLSSTRIGKDGTVEILVSGAWLNRQTYWNDLASSVHNPDATKAMLGKFIAPGHPDSYVVRAGTDHTYFDMGSRWDDIAAANGFSPRDMFSAYNAPFLDAQIAAKKSIHFSQNPLAPEYRNSALSDEIKYLENHDYRFDPKTMTATPLPRN